MDTEVLVLKPSSAANENGEVSEVECAVRCVTSCGLLLEGEALELGDRIDLELAHEGEVAATVVWRKGPFTGCDFDSPISAEAFEALPAIADAGDSRSSEGPPESFGQRLRRMRIERAIDQVDLADRIGVSKVTVWNWESDKSRPRSRSLESLAEIFGCTAPELLHGEVAGQDGVAANGAAPLSEALESYKSEIAELVGTRPQDVAITISFGG